ncbi:MAG: DUF488 domain-containing protein [Acidobacteriia bacterium]|nr:DUF488 domain-containing protein [Terriglobia bacterium]MBV9746954.1 DUF488 domain-containing protein [Terriglobia bacterium]
MLVSGGCSPLLTHSALFTIGHSNRPLPVVLEMLQAHGIGLLVDVRTIPRSRHNPQFNRDTLPAELAAHNIAYEHMPGLGGLRHPRKDSPNTGWRNESFRGYADYMQTEEFARNREALCNLESRWRGLEQVNRAVAIMCSEAVPWRCHRSMVADALLVRGIPVFHIMTTTKADPHKLTSFAHVEGGRITYPGPVLNLFEPTLKARGGHEV